MTHYHTLVITGTIHGPRRVGRLGSMICGERMDSYDEAVADADGQLAHDPLTERMWIVASEDDNCALWDYEDRACDGSEFNEHNEHVFIHCAQLETPYWSRG